MAAMFYSLQEVIEKLNKTEEQIQSLIKQGRLREFRDGPNLLFKVDEVEALLSDTTVMNFEPETEEIQIQPDQDEEEPAKPAETKENKPASEEEISISKEDDTGQFAADDTSAQPQLEPDDAIMDDIMGDTQITPEKTNSTTGAEQQIPEDIVLSDDLLGGTKAADETAGLEELMEESKAAAEELSLEEIEDDVSLDSFGSGSGLLDLSLQADDTSLGGILDEIYTPEGQEQATPSVGADLEPVGPEDDILGRQESAEPQIAPTIAAYVEPAPDKLNNAIGLSLFLPLLAIIYTAIIVLAGAGKFIPSILEPVNGVIWYIVGGLVVVTLLIVGLAAMGGQSGAKPKVKKEKKVKPKKEKKQKPKKEKKKKEKKPKK